MQTAHIIILAFCYTGITGTFLPPIFRTEYPCKAVNCGEEGCRLQEVQCIRAPCPPVPVCTGFAGDAQVRGCPIGEPVLNTNIRDIQCHRSSECPDGTVCEKSYFGGGKCCWKGLTEIPRPASCPRLTIGTIGACVEKCRSDDECPPNTKCCSNGCGHTCQSIEKRGQCPRAFFNRRCSRPCGIDADCTGSMKCCDSAVCGKVCRAPLFNQY